MNQPIWYNSLIRIKGTPIFWKKYYDRGLFWTSQLYSQNNRIEFREAHELYGVNFMDLLTLHNAIDKIRPKELERQTNAQDLHLVETFILSKNITNKAYQALKQKPPDFSRIKNKWELTFDQEINR